MNQLVCFVANQWKKHYDRPDERVVCRLTDTLFAIGCADKTCAELAEELQGHLRGNAPRVRGLGGPDAPGAVYPVHRLCLYRRSPGQKLGCAVQAL